MCAKTVLRAHGRAGRAGSRRAWRSRRRRLSAAEPGRAASEQPPATCRARPRCLRLRKAPPTSEGLLHLPSLRQHRCPRGTVRHRRRRTRTVRSCYTARCKLISSWSTATPRSSMAGGLSRAAGGSEARRASTFSGAVSSLRNFPETCNQGSDRLGWGSQSFSLLHIAGVRCCLMFTPCRAPDIELDYDASKAQNGVNNNFYLTSPNTRASISFRTTSHVFLSPVPPITCHVPCSTW